MSSLSAESQVWLAAHGGVAPADQELVVQAALPEAGPVAVALSYRLPDREEIRLDEWPATASRLRAFRRPRRLARDVDHDLPRSDGTTTVPACPLPPESPSPGRFGPDRFGPRTRAAAERALVDVGDLRETRCTTRRSPFLVDLTDVLGDLVPTPAELSTPPVDWVLPPPLVDQVADGWPATTTRREIGVRFVRFAAESRARFGPSTTESLDTIGEVATTTSIEAIVDDVGRPYALWLRTTEPVDWRRVTTTLRIRHVVQSGACPSAYARRNRLDVSLAVLPNTDASSAFLVGAVGGVWTRLPRGVYELTLTFDPSTPTCPPCDRTPSSAQCPSR